MTPDTATLSLPTSSLQLDLYHGPRHQSLRQTVLSYQQYLTQASRFIPLRNLRLAVGPPSPTGREDTNTAPVIYRAEIGEWILCHQQLDSYRVRIASINYSYVQQAQPKFDPSDINLLKQLQDGSFRDTLAGCLWNDEDTYACADLLQVLTYDPDRGLWEVSLTDVSVAPYRMQEPFLDQNPALELAAKLRDIETPRIVTCV